MNYSGKIIDLHIDETDDQIKSAILNINEQHNLHKHNAAIKNEKSLKYDFENRFSAILFINDKMVDRKYPFNYLTDQYLSMCTEWDYIENLNFKFSPNIT